MSLLARFISIYLILLKIRRERQQMARLSLQSILQSNFNNKIEMFLCRCCKYVSIVVKTNNSAIV